MKIAYYSVLGAAQAQLTAHRGDGIRGGPGEKRYTQLKNMAIEWFDHNDETWDDKKFWNYGCHCIILGDRPMTDFGVGQPVDALDHICKKYKHCQKCVRDKQNNEMCIGEAVAYRWKFKNGEFSILNDAGTCERELGECDRQYVHDMFTHRGAYSDSFNGWKNFDKTDPQNCLVTGNGGGGGGGGSGIGGSGTDGGTDPEPTEVPEHGFECCGGHNKAFHFISTETHQCCKTGKSGVPKPYGELCD